MDSLHDLVTVPSPNGSPVHLGPLREGQVDELWWLFADVVARGDGYPHTPPLTRAVFEDTWVRPVTMVVAAVVDESLAGAYYLKPNGPGLAAHIANAGYVVARQRRGQGIGRLLVAEDAIVYWRRVG